MSNAQQISELELFDQYDPFVDELPRDLDTILSPVVQRARRILDGRTLRELRHALGILRGWRVFSATCGTPMLRSASGRLILTNLSVIQQMYFARDGFDFSRENPHNFHVAELLATLALGKVGALVAMNSDRDRSSATIRTAMTEAIEALGFAEALWIDIERDRPRTLSHHYTK